MNPPAMADAYTAIANAINTVGEQHSQLFLATLCLALISERDSGNGLEALIEQAIRLAKI